MFAHNPEEFISKVVRMIKEQKASMARITLHITELKVRSIRLFLLRNSMLNRWRRRSGKKAVQDYVFTDGSAEKALERRFAEELDTAEEVCVCETAERLKIPTPMGNYSPDWAIAFNKDSVKHIFFVAETKGTLESLELRGIEAAKIKCARRLFNTLSSGKVKYHDVTCYQDLLDKMRAL